VLSSQIQHTDVFVVLVGIGSLVAHHLLRLHHFLWLYHLHFLNLLYHLGRYQLHWLLLHHTCLLVHRLLILLPTLLYCLPNSFSFSWKLTACHVMYLGAGSGCGLCFDICPHCSGMIVLCAHEALFSVKLNLVALLLWLGPGILHVVLV
jgi:hypothetical protein